MSCVQSNQSLERPKLKNYLKTQYQETTGTFKGFVSTKKVTPAKF